MLSNFHDLSSIIHNFDTSDNHEGIINKKIESQENKDYDEIETKIINLIKF